jgi:hypothetical protein
MKYTDGLQPLGESESFKQRRNIILKNADAATAKGFTMVPNFILKTTKLSAGDKMTFAMLLSYAWQRDFCYPGQQLLAEDLGLTDRSVRTHLKALEAVGLLSIADSDGSRPAFRDDLARHSGLMSLAVPR